MRTAGRLSSRLTSKDTSSRVLAGLSQAIPALSFEVVAERIGDAAICIKQLETLGSYRYGFSQGETLELNNSGMGATEILDWLAVECQQYPRLIGDIYATALGSW